MIAVTNEYDIVIVGGGPAGMTAGLYAVRAGKSALLLEAELVGGQAATTDILENYPGFPGGIGGPELMLRFEQQAKEMGLVVRSERVNSVDLQAKTVTTRKATYQARALILSTGARRRKLDVPGERENVGRGVSYCATCDGAIYRGRSVLVVGGGATAAEDALYLANLCPVTLVHRRDTMRADEHVARKVLAHPSIECRWNSVIKEIEATEEGLAAKVANVKNGQESVLNCAGLFVAVGTEPETELFAGQVELDAQGYVASGEDTHASVEGVFVAGDLRKKPLKQVVTAVSDGAVAASEAIKYLQNV